MSTNRSHRDAPTKASGDSGASSRSLTVGTVAALAAYLLWGLLPIYWKQLDSVPATEILMHRVVWSAVFMGVVSLIWYRRALMATLRAPRRLIYVAVAAVLVFCNWFIYTYAVVVDRLVEASLGYYINPLVSVLLGVFVLGERLTRAQIVALALAAVGVLVLALRLGTFPWISLGLAFSFGVYGLIKKIGRLTAGVSLTLEMAFVAPVAAVVLVLIHRNGAFGGVGAFGGAAGGAAGLRISLLLAGAGVATAVPLLLFGAGATRIPLSRIGFLQYLAPTLMLLLGTVVYGEPFTTVHAVSFVLIWIALGIYTVTLLRAARSRRR